MPDPISSLNGYPGNSCVDDETSMPVVPLQSSVVPEPPNQCSTEGGSSVETPNGIQSLVQKFSSTTASKSATPSATGGSSSPFSVRFLPTSDGAVPGGGSYRVAASLVKAEVTSGLFEGSNAERGTVSVQYGRDNDVQVVAGRNTLLASHGGYGLSITGEAGVVRANLGENNDDGSLGGNLGAGAELIGGEATINTPGGSLTGGLSISMSVSGSIGVRDADHDGKPEFCAKFSVPTLTLGACIEQFW